MLLPYKNGVYPFPQRMTLDEAGRLQALYHARGCRCIVHLAYVATECSWRSASVARDVPGALSAPTERLSEGNSSP